MSTVLEPLRRDGQKAVELTSDIGVEGCTVSGMRALRDVKSFCM